MSPWAPNRLTQDPASETGLPPSFTESAAAPFGSAPIPTWLRIVPFFLSAVLFLSAFLAVFSPLPILVLAFMGRGGDARTSVQRGWTLLACVSNCAIIYALGGEVSLATFVVFAVAPSWALIELLARRKSPDLAGGGALLSMAAATGLVILFFAKIHHVHPWGEVKGAVSQFVDYWIKAVTTNSNPAGNAANMSNLPAQDPAELEQWKRDLMVELPSAVAVVALITIWANLTLVLRFNPRHLRARLGIRPDFFQVWKAPEWLVWPTIFAGASLLGEFGTVTDVGRNVFKLMMAIYAMQGLSILSFFFVRWRFNRFFRSLGYLMAVMVVMPLLLSLGFFDLWFDFRSKFRQS